MLTCPSAYIEGYEEARRFDSAVADNYIRHTMIGDPVLDPILEELADLPPADLHRFVAVGIEQASGKGGAERRATDAARIFQKSQRSSVARP